MTDVRLRDYVDGAALVTDLALTAPGLRLGDRLTTIAELGALLDMHGVDHDTLRADDLATARVLRDELVALFGAADVAAGASAVLAACPHRVLAGPEHATSKHGDWRMAPSGDATCVDRVRLVAGASILAVVHALGADRLRVCSSPHCSGMYVDTSTTGRRRFCLPRICGNRVNVARYRARQAP